tara:strand:+ start:363 stop:542 length:180 start_codon:yes stop_codon:yes gene_type:complete
MNKINKIIDSGKWNNAVDRLRTRYDLWFEGFEDSEIFKILRAGTPKEAKEIAREIFKRK